VKFILGKLRAFIVRRLMSFGYEIRKYPNWDFPVMPVFEMCVRSELSHLERIRFIQVGGNDGVRVDPIHGFYKFDERWNGHIFEPNSEIFPLLKNNLRGISSRITAHEIAISSFAGESELHGSGGELKVSALEEPHVASQAFVAAAINAGIRSNDDFNGVTQEGSSSRAMVVPG
jgi:hypothetical protein